MKRVRPVYRLAFINWLLIYPLITLLLWILNPIIGTWVLPAKTFLLTALVVPIMSFGALPMALRIFELWRERN